MKYIYSRVESIQQKKQLHHYASYLQNIYPKHKVLCDIGNIESILNLDSFKLLMKNVNKNIVDEIVIVDTSQLYVTSNDYIADFIHIFNVNVVIKQYNKEVHDLLINKNIWNDWNTKIYSKQLRDVIGYKNTWNDWE